MHKIFQKILATLLVICFTGSNLCYAKVKASEKVYDFSDEAQAKFDQQQKIVKIPIGTVLHLKLNDNLASTTVSKSDLITVQLSKDWYSKGILVAPEGSIVTGKVTELQNSGKNQKDGKIAIDFYEILKPDGTISQIKTKNLIIKVNRNAFLRACGTVLLFAAIGAAAVATGGTALAAAPIIAGAGGGALAGGLLFSETTGQEVEISANMTYKRTKQENTFLIFFLI